MARFSVGALGSTLIVAAVISCDQSSDVVKVNDQADTLMIVNGVDSLAILVGVTPTVISELNLEVGDTARLSATAFNAEGFPIAATDIRWSSSTPSVTSVSESGIVAALSSGRSDISAEADGATALIRGNVVDTVDAPVPLFSDDFETGDLDLSQGGVVWAGSNKSPTCESLEVTDLGPALSGSHSLIFDFGPTPTAGAGTLCEQRFQLGAFYREVWIEYHVYVPTPYGFEDNSNAFNNKFFSLYSTDYSAADQEVHVVFEYVQGSDDTFRSRIASAQAEGYEDRRVGQADSLNFQTMLERGDAERWIEVRIHLRAEADSSVVHWCFDRELVAAMMGDYSIVDPDWSEESQSFFTGHIFGAQNHPPFSPWYVDDFKVWINDPGWSPCG